MQLKNPISWACDTPATHHARLPELPPHCSISADCSPQALRAFSILSGWERALKRTNFNPKRYESSHLIYTSVPGMESGTWQAPSPLALPMLSCDQQVEKGRHREGE